MTKKLYEGYVEIVADMDRGMVWVCDVMGRCRIRIGHIPRLGERLTSPDWMVDVVARKKETREETSRVLSETGDTRH